MTRTVIIVTIVVIIIIIITIVIIVVIIKYKHKYLGPRAGKGCNSRWRRLNLRMPVRKVWESG